MYMMSFVTLSIFWGRAADAVELSCPLKPQSGMDLHRVPIRSDDNAVFNEAAGGAGWECR
jgi:hypothetical protein